MSGTTLVQLLLFSTCTAVLLIAYWRVRVKAEAKVTAEPIPTLDGSANDFLEAISEETMGIESFEGILAYAIRKICVEFNWDVGHAYLAVTNGPGLVQLKPSRLWYFEPKHELAMKAFKQTTMAFNLAEGIGLPGKAYSTKACIWKENLQLHQGIIFLRAKAVPNLNLRGALAIPMQGKNGVEAVLEFFCADSRPEHAGQLAVLKKAKTLLERAAERLRAIEELNTRAEFLESVLSNVGDAVVTADAAGVVTTWNRMAEQIFQIPAAEMIGKSLDTIVPERFRAAHRTGIARVANGGDRRLIGKTVEIFGLRRDGTEVPIEFSLASWTRGRKIFFTGVIRDMSLRVAARETESKMIAASKMSTLGEMAGGIAHEINNPLAVVTLLNEQVRDLIEEEPIDGPALLQLNVAIDKSVDRIGKIVKGLRSFARNEDADPPTNFSFKEMVEDTRVLCEERFRVHGVPLKIDTIPEDIFFVGHRAQLSQVLLNLFNNAFDAIQELAERWVRLELETSEDKVIMRVIDSGHGISPEGLLKIFNPFFTTKPVGVGTGLGLSISKGIVEKHGGTLSVDSSHRNTCFVITLSRPQVGENIAA